MKKRLLFMFAAALSAASSFAYEVGDFVYTPNGRFQIIGANLVKNGDFTDGLNNWTNLYCQPLSPDTFAVTNDGPDGRNCLTTLQGATSVSNYGPQCANFAQDVTLSENTTYLCTYKVRAFVPNMSSVGVYGRYYNHQNFVFPNTPGVYPLKGGDGDESGKLSGGLFGFSSCSDQWEERTMDYRAEESKTMSVLFFELVPNDSYADFGIYEAKQVFDDRMAKDAVSFIEMLIADKVNFPNDGPEGEREMLGAIVEDLRGAIGSDLDVISFEDMYNGIMGPDGPVTAFLNANSADVSSYYTNFTLDEAAEQGTGKTTTPAKGWTATNNRWGVNAASFNFTTNHFKSDNKAQDKLEASSVSQGANLPAGKYLYIVRGLGYKMGNNGKGSKDNYYIPDYYSQIEGVKYFVNNDSVDMTDFQTSYAKMYTNIFDVKEDGIQTIGFAYPTIDGADTGSAPPAAHTGSGTFRFDNVEIRILGLTDDDVKNHFLKKTLADKRADLTAAIDAAKEAADSKKYVFFNSVLRDSIVVSEKVLAEITSPSQENIDILVAQKENMDKAVRAYTRANAEYVKLGSDIELCKTELADENRPKGKDVFDAAINVAENYYSAQTDQSRDSLTLVKTDSTLMKARLVYGLTNASISAPADINMVNGSFSTKNATGWTVDGVGGNGVWKYQSNSDFTDGYCAYYNRGSSAKDSKYIYQDVELPMNGVYEFSAEIICRNHNMGDATQEASTEMYIFAGTDSTEVYTMWDASKTHSSNPSQDYPGKVTRFSKVVKVQDINSYEDKKLRVGLTCKNEGQTIFPNLIYIGSCHLYYLGSIADYETGITDVNVVDGINSGDVYSINGVKVRANANTLKGLSKGIYIMNGKKYVVK